MIILPKRQIWTRQPQYVRRLAPGIPQPHALWIPGLGDVTRRYDTLTEADATDSFGRAYQITAAPSSRKTLVSSSDFVSTGGGFSVLVLTRQTGDQNNGGFNVGVVGGGATDRCALSLYGADLLFLDYGGYVEGVSRVSVSGTNNASGILGCYLATTGPSGMRLYTNGSLVASNSLNPSRGATSSAFAVGDIYNGTATAHNVGLIAVWTTQIPDALARSLSENPWRVFADEETLIFMPSAGGGASAALTGSAISTAVGSLAVSITVPLSGNSLTSTSGVLGPGLALGLSGSAENLTAGTVSCSVELELSGNSQAFSFGTVTVSSGYFASLTGSEQLFSSGSLSPEIELALSGNSLGFAQGTVVVGASYIVALTGLGQTLSSGTLAPEIELSINGQAQTLAFGIFSPDIQTTLTGRSMTLTPGTLSIAGGSGGIGSLDPATIAAIAAAIWSDPRAPTIAKLLAIKDG